MIANNATNLSFKSYLQDAKNGFKHSEDTIQRCNYVYGEIDTFYNTINANQGFIGKTWDKIKCFFNMKTSSKNTEDVMKKYEHNIFNSSNEAEAILAMNKYAQSQELATNVSRNITAGVVAGGAQMLIKKLAKSSNKKIAILAISAGAILGATAGVGLKALDAKSAKRQYDKKEFKKDFSFGLAEGLFACMFNFGANYLFGENIKVIPKKIAKTFAKACFDLLSVFSMASFEKSINMTFLKIANPEQYKKIKDKIELEKMEREYQFYK